MANQPHNSDPKKGPVADERGLTNNAPKLPSDAKPPEPPPIKDSNPPDAETHQPAAEVPKVGSRDAPGG
jgi:hypothetical protein